MMNFISFLIVTEIVMLENKHLYLSSTLKNRRLNYLKLTKIKLILKLTYFRQVPCLVFFLRCSMEMRKADPQS